MARNPYDMFDNDPLPQRPMVIPPDPSAQAEVNARNTTAAASAQNAQSSALNAQTGVAAEVRQDKKLTAELPGILAQAKTEELTTAEKQREAEKAILAKIIKENNSNEKIDAALKAITDARGKLNNYSTGFGVLLKNLPTSDSRSLRNDIDVIKANNMLGEMTALKEASPTGSTGFGSLALAEGKVLQDSTGALDQGEGKDNVAKRLDDLERHYKRMRPILRGENPDDEATAKKYGLLPNREVDTAPPEVKLLDGGNKVKDVPQEAQKLHAQMLTAIPRGKLTVEAYRAIRDRVAQAVPGGIGSSADNPKEIEDYVKSYNDPKQPISIVIPGTEVAPTATERNITNFGQTPTGSFIMNAANAGGMGLPSLLAGEEGRKGLDLVSANSPRSALAGEIIGSMSGVKGLSAATGGKMLNNGVVRDVLTDMAYSGARGFNEADSGEGVDSAVANALLAGGSNLGARGVMRGLRDLGDPALRKTAEGYANLTPMQQIGAPQLENAIKDLPLVHAAKEESVKAFSRDYKDRGLQEIGKKLSDNTVEGRASIDEMQREIQTGYNEFKARVGGKLTSNGRTQIKNLLDESQYTDPDQLAALAKIKKAVGNLGGAGKVDFTGEELLEVNSRLTKLANDFGKADPKFNPNKADAYQQMGRTAAELRELIAGRLPSRADQTRLRDLNRAYSKELQINSAAGNAVGEGIVSPEAALAAVKKFDPSQGKADFAAGNARFQDEAEEALRVLGASPSGDVSGRNAGIARLLLPGVAIGGAAGGASGDDAGDTTLGAGVGGVAAALLAAGAYGKNSRKIIQPIIAGKRPLGLDQLDPSIVSQAVQALFRGVQ